MTATNWPNCIAFTLSFEGGYDTDPRDRGNWDSGVIGRGTLKGTKYGIDAAAHPNEDIKNLTKAQAVAIYQRDYWPKVAGDSQPEGVDLVEWDICVNSGSGRALQFLREALSSGVTSAVGLAALARTVPDKVAVIKTICARRSAFYQSLSTFVTYGRGWLRRNSSCEAQSVSMALSATGKPAEEIKKDLHKESEDAKGTATKHAGGAATGTGSTGAAGWGIDWASLDWTTIALYGVGVAVVVGLVIYFAQRAAHHNERAKAYAQAAQGIVT